jgi:hypothetical protein
MKDECKKLLINKLRQVKQVCGHEYIIGISLKRQVQGFSNCTGLL